VANIADNIKDVVMRSDGRFFGYQSVAGADNQVGNLVQINPEDGSLFDVQSDEIVGRNPTLNLSDLGNPSELDTVATSDAAGALTFRRTGVGQYETLNAVHETDSLEPAVAKPNSKLYSNNTLKGDIQPPGVTYASLLAPIPFADATPNLALVDVVSKIPGTDGNFTINIVEGNIANSTIDANPATGVINISLDNDPNPTAGGIVDLINGDANARQMVVANVRVADGLTGPGQAADVDGSVAGAYNGILGLDGPTVPFLGLDGPLNGRVTGLAYADFNGNLLFGVTDAGELILIDDNTGAVTARADFGGLLVGDFEFQGLALGPQNVEVGTYSNTLFAITGNGILHAIDPAQLLGNLSSAATLQNALRPIFDTDGDGIADSASVSTGRMNVEGLAFSPLDFNMWHTTTRRGTDLGHGVNAAPDFSREAVEGGTSLYFGIEAADGQLQHGILNPEIGDDLASNPLIAGTYNMPGGGYGSLETDTFDLAGSDYHDRPALYFNYFLETEGHVGGSDAANPFRDSARAYISENGTDWELLTTNNSALNQELAAFKSQFSDDGLNSATPRPENQQLRQELHDNTGQWRQARVDLSTYAGKSNLQLRFDFSTAGKMSETFNLGTDLDGAGGHSINDPFGELNDPSRSILSTNNNHEGFYIDDIIIGYAERGEMVTGVVADSAIVEVAPNPVGFNNPAFGQYQLEVRRTEDQYIVFQEGGANYVDHTKVFDTDLRYVVEDVLNEADDAVADTTIVPGGIDADRNRERPQGVFIIDSNFITESQVRGVNIEPGVPQAGGNVPHPGSVIQFPQLNAGNLVPGVVVQNNVIAGSSGIRFAGEAAANPNRPVSFGRIINNTIVGDGGTGVGVSLEGRTSPTLINNLLTDLANGINGTGIQSVVKSNFFQDNNNNGTIGTDAILAAAGDPLFLDASNGNYILESDSLAVDSSQNTEQDRLNYLNFKTEIGLPASPIFAPDRDIYGQLRVDSNAGLGGGGSAIFKDRGATDRADTDAPYAVLLNPVDNDALGEDTDPTTTIVRVTDPLLENFTILLGDGPGPNSPFEGTGVDNQTVDDPNDPNISARAITISRNREFLEEGVDYNVGYNELTGVLLLTPLSTLWEPTGVYTIELDNTLIADRVGNRLRPNQTDGSTQFTVIMPQVEIDFGDADPSYATLIADDGPRHAIIDGSTPRLGKYVDGEFDALVIDQDDNAIVDVAGNAGEPGDGPFVVIGSGTPQVTVDLTVSPNVGDTLSVTTESMTLVFELVPEGGSTTGFGRIPVVYPAGATVSDIADLLAGSMQTEFAVEYFQGAVTHTPGTTQITLDALDDEDGVAVGLFDDGGAGQIVFITPGTDPSDALTEDIAGFLNPLDPWGTNVPVTVAGQGLLQAWVDFDQSGTFDDDEQVITDEPVSDIDGGLNVLTIFTPEDAAAGRTWMRVRVSKDAGLSPTEFSIGGETEDYQIDVIPVPVPVPQDDFYEFNEDTTLTFPPAAEITANDLLIPDESVSPVDVQYLIGVEPTFGTLELASTDFLETGNFTYTPNADFNGIDTFTYRIITQDSGLINGDVPNAYATVTLSVLPVNDVPDASAAAVTGEEDRALLITQSDLLASANPDNEEPSPFVRPADSTLNPRDEDLMNEVNQTFVITEVQGDGVSVSAAVPASSGTNLTINELAGGVTITVTNTTVGDVFSLAYAGTTATFELLDLNSPEPRDGTVSVSVDPATADADSIAAALAAGIAGEFAGQSPAMNVVANNNIVSVSFTALDVNAVGAGTSFDAASTNVVNVVAEPMVGDSVTLALDGNSVVFELVAEGDSPTGTGNIGVDLLPFADPASPAAQASAADQLMRAMNTAFVQQGWGVAASIDPVTDANQIVIGESAVTAGRAFTTNRGEAIALFDHAGALIEMYYIGNTDLNRDNAPVVNGNANNLDEISFVATDDGISIDLVNNRFVYGQPETAPIATAEITILPQNDVPVAGDDEIRMDNADLDPATNVDVTAWEQFFGIGVVPEPTEDTPLTIPGAFLIQNDLRGRASAADENIDPLEADNNDLRIVVASVAANWDTNTLGGSVTVNLATGDVELVPPTDRFGDISFTYTIKDLGRNLFIDGSEELQILESSPATVTVAFQPVNDVPVAHDRSLAFTESGDDVADVFTFTAAQLLNGAGLPETANTPHVDTSLPFPFNEATQQLRVVEFTTAAGTVVAPPSGSGDVVLASDQGGLYTFTFANFAFVSGTFEAAPNYNERAPFIAPETFTYRVADDGLASASALGQGYQDFDQPDQVSLIDQQGTVSITVAETNDAPGFDIPELTLDILERDDELGTVIVGFAENILPGPATAIDETAHQNVSFSVTLDSSVPNDLIQAVTLSPTGDLTVITHPDAVGQATMIVTATDAPRDSGEPFIPRTTVEQIIVNVRPVNDAPRLDGSVVGTDSGITGGPDKAWSVGSEDALGQAPITYTLREDNTQSGGVMQDYTIPVTGTVVGGYQQRGLLDVFTVGPQNELVDVFDGFPGGAPFDTATEQRLELIDFGVPSELNPSVVITDRGGVLTPVVDQVTGLITALQYTPPLDFNESLGGLDSFLYTVQDNNVGDGETYDLVTGALVEDRLTRTNRVHLRMNAVNDRPVFTPETQEVVVLEDSAEFTRPNYAINILGGPLLTAFDEHSQNLSFTLDLVGRPGFYSDPNLTVNDFFSVVPNIDVTTGVLNFKPAADVFGAFEFDLLLVDDGLNDMNRGDLNSSDPFQVTIHIRPVNDPPVDQNPVDLDREIAEDTTTEWDEATLLSPFVAGPENETTMNFGGEQTIRLAPTAFPTDSKNGGIVHYVEENGEIKLRYTPRVDFNGVDEFIYTVIDDGESISVDGTVSMTPRVATKTVFVNVLSVNDKPRFSGVFDQQNLENDGVVSVPDWATNVLPAAETASDEISQDLQFVFDLVSGPVDIFETLPTAVIDRANMSATLDYTLKDDVSGVVVFDVTLVDDGEMFDPADNPPRAHEWVSDPPRRVTITVEGVNNPPSFDLDVSAVNIAEDSGPYSQAVMSSISPGPADESGQVVSFEIAELTVEQTSVFAAQPVINSDGVLQFTTAVHQNTVQLGPVVLTVTARDSAGGVSEPVVISIAVSEQNDAPVAVDDTLDDTDEDSLVIIPQTELLSNDLDPDLVTNDNEALVVVLSTNSSAFGATLELDTTTGDIVYDATDASAIQSLQPGESLIDFFTYRAEDNGGLLSGLGTVSVRVSGINDAPTVVDDKVDVDESGVTVIHVLSNDRDVDGTIRESTVEFGLVPAFGTVSVNAQGVVTYRSFGELTNDDTFSYSVKDNLGARSNEAVVTISSNQPPIAENDVAFTYIAESVLIDILDNDADADGFIDEQSVSIRNTPANGGAVIQADGQVIYSPATGFAGTDTFQYVVSDDGGRESNLATVTVTVLASRLQNSANKYDVNGDGLVTALDPLRIVNYLEAANAASIPVSPTAVGPDYLDVNGNGFVSVNDALQVLNELTRIPSGSGEEAPQLAPLAEERSNLSQIDQDVWGVDANDWVPTEIAKLSNCLPLAKEDVIDLLAAEKDSEPEGEILKAVDEVLTDLI
ncbi:MAG: tandem-95 repeat protein, partial [Planctomycetaceae bacterium]|nr:tandem-95 repeat protein [Planctomycetaceae bacterium]